MSSSDQDLDFSTTGIPDSWHEAAADAPKGETKPRATPKPLQLLPSGQSAEIAPAILAGLAMSIVAGYSWYELSTTGALTSPWVPVGLGALQAVAVRLGGGGADPQARAILSLLLYLITWTVVVLGISRYLFADLYGSGPSLLDYERDLIHSRLADPAALAAWVAGAAVAVKVSYLSRHRR